jgi:hypothetical protein
MNWAQPDLVLGRSAVPVPLFCRARFAIELGAGDAARLQAEKG